jgi:hypothetical protein
MPVILAIQDVEIRRIIVQGQPRQKQWTPISTNSWVYGTLLLSLLPEKSKYEDINPDYPRQKISDPFQKQLKAKRARVMTQDHLLSKPKTLSSTPLPPMNKEINKGKKEKC